MPSTPSFTLQQNKEETQQQQQQQTNNNEVQLNPCMDALIKITLNNFMDAYKLMHENERGSFAFGGVITRCLQIQTKSTVDYDDVPPSEYTIERIKERRNGLKRIIQEEEDNHCAFIVNMYGAIKIYQNGLETGNIIDSNPKPFEDLIESIKGYITRISLGIECLSNAYNLRCKELSLPSFTHDLFKTTKLPNESILELKTDDLSFLILETHILERFFLNSILDHAAIKFMEAWLYKKIYDVDTFFGAAKGTIANLVKDILNGQQQQ